MIPFHSEAAGGVYISFGAHDLRQHTQEGVQTIQAGAIYTHSGYRNLNYDYALVKLSSAVTLSDKVRQNSQDLAKDQLRVC